MSGKDDGQPLLRLALTMGDPCGIGPEICLKATAGGRLPSDVSIVIVGSLAVLRATATAIGCGVKLHQATEPTDSISAGTVPILDMDNFPTEKLRDRKACAEGGSASLEYITKAVQMALDGQVDAVVTAPISKEAIGAAGSTYPGHTEMLGELTGSKNPVMLLVTGGLRVALATTHMALRDVADRLRSEKIVQTASVLADALRRYFGIGCPRLAVCGLNPHCGDAGRFGDEERRIIEPAVKTLRDSGIDLRGPLPADTLFTPAAQGEYDAVVAMYHDQGMIPVKMSGVGKVVNVTLGLPIIRTSVGHGTAYDIAGTGRADEASLLEAIRLAVSMARVRRNDSDT